MPPWFTSGTGHWVDRWRIYTGVLLSLYLQQWLTRSKNHAEGEASARAPMSTLHPKPLLSYISSPMFHAFLRPSMQSYEEDQYQESPLTLEKSSHLRRTLPVQSCLIPQQGWTFVPKINAYLLLSI